jgi:pimeloyl-ACP methyl ester carboxylesterase
VDVDLWSVWDAVKCPVLVLHGEESDLLTDETIQEMKRRKNDVQVINIPRVGHVPALLDPNQQTELIRFLEQ